MRRGRNKNLREPRDSFERAIDNGGMQLVDSLSDDDEGQREEDRRFHAIMNDFAMNMDTSATTSDDWENLFSN